MIKIADRATSLFIDKNESKSELYTRTKDNFVSDWVMVSIDTDNKIKKYDQIQKNSKFSTVKKIFKTGIYALTIALIIGATLYAYTLYLQPSVFIDKNEDSKDFEKPQKQKPQATKIDRGTKSSKSQKPQPHNLNRIDDRNIQKKVSPFTPYSTNRKDDPNDFENSQKQKP